MQASDWLPFSELDENNDDVKLFIAKIPGDEDFTVQSLSRWRKNDPNHCYSWPHDFPPTHFQYIVAPE